MKSIFCHKAKTAPPAANTLRFEFSDQSYSPVTDGVGSSGTWKKCDWFLSNVWDWTRNNPNWSGSFDNAFNNTGNLVKIIDAGDTSGVTNLSRMFRACASITELCLFDTSNVTSFYIFTSRAKFSKIPLYDTRNVTNFEYAFYSCQSLKTIPLLNTEKATAVSYMFQDSFNVEIGALELYNQMSTQTTPPASHNLTFSKCGRDTVTGAAELAQIPVSWGGTKEEV